MIVTDVRYPNELLDYNILISRKGVIDLANVHHSELMCKEFALGVQDPLESGIDYIVLNNGTQNDLETSLRFLATTITR